MVDRNIVSKLGLSQEKLDQQVSEMFGEKENEFLEEALRTKVDSRLPGTILKGTIVSQIGNDVIIEVGLKSEGVVDADEFEDPDEISPGKEIEVLLEDTDSEGGLVLLSKHKADRIRGWEMIIDTKKEGDVVSGKVIRRPPRRVDLPPGLRRLRPRPPRRVVIGEQVTALEFSIQLKATDRLKTSADHVLHRCKVSSALYFLRRPEPVMYLVYDAQGETAYWLWVQPYLRELDDTRPGWRDQKTVQIRVPATNVLSSKSVPAIANAVQVWWARVVPAVGWDYAPTSQAARRPFQLPPDLPTFTGRDDYLAKLDKLLQPGTGHTVGLVGLRGTAGVGKSALAIHAAHRWGDRFRDGVVWVDLRQRDVPAALWHIAATYGYRDQATQLPDAEGLAALVRTVLHQRQVLIILDNAENVPPEQFSLLLPGAPGCVTLVTSRRSFPELARHGRVLSVGQMPENGVCLDRSPGARFYPAPSPCAGQHARGRRTEHHTSGGCQPALTHRRRARTIVRLFICNVATVARPQGVRPTICVLFSSQAKWSCQRCRKGWNRGVVSPVRGSMPVCRAPL